MVHSIEQAFASDPAANLTPLVLAAPALVSAANANSGGLDNLLWIIAAVCLLMTAGTAVGTRRFSRTATAEA